MIFSARSRRYAACLPRLSVVSPDCVAIVPAVSYGIALAAKNLPVEKGQSIVVLQDQFPSNVYSWHKLAGQKKAVVKTVPRPKDYDWTAALLESIDDDTAIVAVPHCHWTDGSLIDLEIIGEQCRSRGAALVVDGIQSTGRHAVFRGPGAAGFPGGRGAQMVARALQFRVLLR